MDKKFLGLGFTFAAVDDGLKNMFRGLSNQFGGINDDLETTNKKGKEMFGREGFFGQLMDFTKIGALGHISSQLKDLRSGLLGEDAADATFETLERFMADMKFAGKVGEDMTKRITEGLLRVSETTGAMPDDMSKVVVGLMKSGVAAEDVEKNLQRMGELLNVFKMSADDVGSLFRVGLSEQMKLSSDQLNEFVKTSLGFSKSFHMPPDLNALPKILESITQHTAFKGLRGRPALEAAQGIQRMSVMFQALGKQPEVATDAAVTMFAKMKDMEKNFTKLTSGLDADVNEFYRSALIAGPKSAVAAMKSNDPSLMFQRLRDAMVEANKRGGQEASVIRSWIEDTFGPDVANAVGSNWEKVSERLSQARPEKDGQKAYDEYVGLIRSTVSYTKDLASASEQAMEIQLQFAASKEIQAGLRLRIEAFKNMRQEIIKGDTALVEFAKTAEIFEKAGLTGVALQMALAGKSFEDLTDAERALLETTTKGAVSVGLFGDSFDKILTRVALLGISISTMRSTFNGLGVTFSSVLRPLTWIGEKLGLMSKVMADGTTKVGFFAKHFKSLAGIIEGPASMLGKLGQVITKVVTGPFKFFAKMAQNVTKLGSSFQLLDRAWKVLSIAFKNGGMTLKFLGTAFKVFGKVMTRILFPLGIVISAVESLWTNWTALVDAFQSFDTDNLTDSFLRLGKVFGDIMLSGIDSFFLGLPSLILGEWITSIDGIKEKFWDMVSWMAEKIRAIPIFGEKIISDDAFAKIKEFQAEAGKDYARTVAMREGRNPSEIAPEPINLQRPEIPDQELQFSIPDFGMPSVDINAPDIAPQEVPMIMGEVPAIPQLEPLRMEAPQAPTIEPMQMEAPQVPSMKSLADEYDKFKMPEPEDKVIKSRTIVVFQSEPDPTVDMSELDSTKNLKIDNAPIEKKMNVVMPSEKDMAVPAMTVEPKVPDNVLKFPVSDGMKTPEIPDVEDRKVILPEAEKNELKGLPTASLEQQKVQEKERVSALDRIQRRREQKIVESQRDTGAMDGFAAAVGREVANALMNMKGDGKAVNVNVTLAGDVKKFMRVQRQMVDNAAIHTGTYGQRGV